MVEMFDGDEISLVKAKSRRALILYFVVAAISLALVVAFVFLQSRATAIIYLTLNIVITSLLGAFTIFFLAVPYRHYRSYEKMFRDMQTGHVDVITAKFVEFVDSPEFKGGVTYYSVILDTAPLKRTDIVTRKMLIECTRPHPTWAVGQPLKLYSHANILMRYETIE